tara:strand:+ start:3833 stop:4912 length:1080 start_codon:yes stop_codon:yes gene_type:complete
MAIIGQKITEFREEYSENLLPANSLFNNAIPVNLTSGSASFDFTNDYNFAGGKSLYCFMQSYKTTDIAFNFGSELTTTINNTGNYIFSFRLLNANTTTIGFPAFVIYAKIWVNGINVDDLEFHMVSDETTYSKKWVTFAQSYNFTQTDEVDFSFYIDADLSYPFNNLGFYIDGLKLEYDDRFLGTPSIYSKPLDNFATENYCNNLTGWGRYLDDTYTVGSPLSILSGVRGTFTNNAVSKLETQLPSDATTFFDETTQKIIATNNGDSYNLSIRFKAKMSVNNGYFDIDLDIGGTQGIISQESVVFTRSANTEQRFDIDLTVFSGSTFVANGGTLSITPQNGNMEIYDISFVIVRTHKAK